MKPFSKLFFMGALLVACFPVYADTNLLFTDPANKYSQFDPIRWKTYMDPYNIIDSRTYAMQGYLHCAPYVWIIQRLDKNGNLKNLFFHDLAHAQQFEKNLNLAIAEDANVNFKVSPYSSLSDAVAVIYTEGIPVKAGSGGGPAKNDPIMINFKLYFLKHGSDVQVPEGCVLTKNILKNKTSESGK